MQWLADYRSWLVAVVVTAVILLAAWLLIEADAAACRTDCPPPPYPSPRPAATLTVELRKVWTLEQAGLAGPSAWLTAPRETPGFAATRAAIAAAYDKAERRETAALRRAGMTKRKGWACA